MVGRYQLFSCSKGSYLLGLLVVTTSFIIMNDSNIKEKEKRAFWIGLGTIVAGICIIIAVVSLIFSGGGESQEQVVDESDSGQEETVQEPKQEREEPEPEPEEPTAQEETTSQPEEESGSEETYEVQAGDTLFEIGLEYGVDWQDIVEANDLGEDAVLTPGDQLIIPN